MSKTIGIIVTFLFVSLMIGCASVKNNPIVAGDVSSNMKVYQYRDYGYEIAYPQEYEVQISGGHSPLANPEFGMRLSLYSKDNPSLDIDSIDKVNYKDKYQSIEEFIIYKHLDIKLDEDYIIDEKTYKIYKLEDDNYYFSFVENDKYIFQLSSSSKTLLRQIIQTFKFI